MKRRYERARTERIRLLRAELDTQATRSIERTQSIETKSSFIVAAAALLAGVSLPSTASNGLWYFALLPLTMAGLTVFYAAKAIAPLTLDVPGARLMVDSYVDANMAPSELEDTLLEVRVQEIENRDALNQSRAAAMKKGFVLLTWSIVALVVVAILSGTAPEGNATHAKTTPSPRPSSTSQTP